jgi:hypothetical protein
VADTYAVKRQGDLCADKNWSQLNGLTVSERYETGIKSSEAAGFEIIPAEKLPVNCSFPFMHPFMK